VDSRVHPKINGLRVFAIPVRDSDQAKVATIVQVPQGTTAHMASENKYYKRRDRTVSAMWSSEPYVIHLSCERTDHNRHGKRVLE